MALPRRLALVVAALLAVAGCGGSSSAPPPPSTPPGGGSPGDTITGRERIGWDQAASGASELTTFKYAIYLDGNRSEMADVTCADTSGSAGFPCSGKLPAMTAGAHTLEIATFITASGGGTMESAKSATLRVTVQAALAENVPATAWAAGPAGVTRDGTALAVERLAEGLVDPVDLAVAPDGRVFVAERSGRVHILEGAAGDGSRATAVDVEGGELVAIALDTAFARTHAVYALYAAATADGRTYRLSRAREVNGTLGERAVLLNDIAPATDPAAALLRVSSDGRVIVGIGNATAASTRFEGKLLRVAADGTTPPDQNGTPVLAGGLEEPRAAAWDAGRSALWTLDRRIGGYVLTSVVLAPGEPARVGSSVQIGEPGAASVTVTGGSQLPNFDKNVLLASPEGRYILRLRPLETGRAREFAAERLLQDRVGAVRLVAAAPDGSVYFTTADALGRIVLQR
jgi:glucose/arabinose dehydrogenase